FIEEYKKNNLGFLSENEPLSKHTTFRVGGPARIFVKPNSKESLAQTIELIQKKDLKYKVIGKGSNLLPSDSLFEGVIVKCDKGLDYIEVEGHYVTVGAGVSTIVLATQVAKQNLSGLEFISGVPGTVGGAIYMNAGAYNKEMKDVLKKVLVIDEKGELIWLSNEELSFGYRTSIMQEKKGWTVIEAVLELEAGDYEAISELMKKRKARRVESQPINMPSAGSTFRNPLPHYSWKLIEEAGLRGMRIGGAEVSTKHCNFIVNVGGATSQDIYDLIQQVQSKVLEKDGIELHPEVEMFNW
ncbi:MAG: UDP-N-acetylmuramate dehydrogenase, partial [Turicibacter sp.]|nr:UDP-N-acetylmuramate dehydrogenase [Turicibacter sp.]